VKLTDASVFQSMILSANANATPEDTLNFDGMGDKSVDPLSNDNDGNSKPSGWPRLRSTEIHSSPKNRSFRIRERSGFHYRSWARARTPSWSRYRLALCCRDPGASDSDFGIHCRNTPGGIAADYAEALRRDAAGDKAGAIAKLASVIEADPTFARAYYPCSGTLRRSGRPVARVASPYACVANRN